MQENQTANTETGWRSPRINVLDSTTEIDNLIEDDFLQEGDSESRIFENHQQPSPASANVEISEKNLTGNSSPREMFSPQEIDLSTAFLLLIFLYSPARAVKWKKEYAGMCEN